MALSVFAFAVVDARILKQYGEEQANGTLVADVITIAASLLLVSVAVFGCVGAVRDNGKILYLVSFVFVLQESFYQFSDLHRHFLIA